MGVYSGTTANAYADKIKAVYEYLGEIRKVADRLTPIEDVTSFRVQITALYAQLDLLVEASTLIVTATPTGESILTGSVPSIRTLLGIANLPADYVTQAELDAALAGLAAGSGAGMAGLGNDIAAINIVLTALDQYRIIQLTQISGLQISYNNLAAGLETNQTNTTSALSRLTVQEQYAVLYDQRLDSIDQSLVSTTTGIQATNATLAGHTATIASSQNSIFLHTASIDQLTSTLANANTNLTAQASALSLMETTIIGVGQDITAQATQTTALKSVIGGSGNLLSNADFSAGANGWDITVAQEDWINTMLTVDTFNMPVEVHCLEALGLPSPLGQLVVESPPVLVQAGSYYIVSGYPCVDNGTISLSYKIFGAAGEVLAQGVCPPTFNTTTSLNFNDYTRSWVKFLAPVGALKIKLYLTVVGDGDWYVYGALFRPMIERGWAEQVGPSEWTPNIFGVPEALAEAISVLSTRVSVTEQGIEAAAANTTQLSSQLTFTDFLLGNALSATQTAQNTADAALSRIGDIASDGVLTPNEKSQLILDYNVILSEQAGIVAQANASAITTERDTYNTTITALTDYLATLTSPVMWNDTSGNTILP